MSCRLEENTFRGIIIALAVIKMPPRTCSRKFHRISTKVLLIIPIVSQIWLITCDCFSLNGTLLNTLNGYTLFGNSSPPTTIKAEPYYPNHRMDVGDDSSHKPMVLPKNNTTHRYQDRETSGSMLRPQLALQIYTNTNPSNHMQDDGSHKSQSSQAHISAAIKPSSTMVILPAMSKSEHNTDHLTSDRKRHHQGRGSPASPSSTSLSDRPNDGHHSRGQHSSRVNTQASNNNKLNHWHYITDQTASSNSVESFAGTSGRDIDSFADRGSGSSHNGSPLINAIITVPTPTSEHHHHHHHNPQQQNYHFNQASEDNSTALQSSIEQTIARLMDDPSNGNIEFSMNLNGDEIIINPVPVGTRGGRGAIISGSLNGTKLSLHETMENQDESLLPRRYLGGRGGVGKDGGKSSRKNHPSESEPVVGNQQSASEIDLIDGGSSEGDDNDLDFDHTAASKGVPNGHSRSAKSSSHRGSSRNYHMRDFNSQLEDDDDEPATNESNQDGRITKGGYSRTNYGDNDDKRASNNVASGKQHQQIQGSRRKNQAASRKVSSTGGKRRPVYRSEDREFDLDPDERVASSSTSASGKRRDSDKTDGDVPSVTIKGEDVKRFEQLLENLRSLSLNNASGSKSKRNLQIKEGKKTQVVQKTPTQSASTDSDDLDDQYQGKGEDSPSSSYSKKTWSNGESTTVQQQDKKGQSSRQSDGGNDGETSDDCERRRRQQQQLNKSNGDSDSSNGSYESDSSPNIVEQDPMTSSDGVDDLNDDASTQSQTSEQEDPGSNNQNVSLPITTKTTSSSSSPEAGSSSELAEQTPGEQEKERQQSDGQAGERKSALQAYYDSQDNAISGGGGDDLKAIHRTQHDTLHDRHSGLNDGSSTSAADNDQPTTTTTTGQRKIVTITRTRQTPADGPQLNNYIDYSNLDDGEIYRVSESKRVRTYLPPRKYMDKMRTVRLAGRADDGGERPRGRIVANIRE